MGQNFSSKSNRLEGAKPSSIVSVSGYGGVKSPRMDHQRGSARISLNMGVKEVKNEESTIKSHHSIINILDENQSREKLLMKSEAASQAFQRASNGPNGNSSKFDDQSEINHGTDIDRNPVHDVFVVLTSRDE
jgi:hypothetical protein